MSITNFKMLKSSTEGKNEIEFLESDSGQQQVYHDGMDFVIFAFVDQNAIKINPTHRSRKSITNYPQNEALEGDRQIGIQLNGSYPVFFQRHDEKDQILMLEMDKGTNKILAITEKNVEIDKSVEKLIKFSFVQGMKYEKGLIIPQITDSEMEILPCL